MALALFSIIFLTNMQINYYSGYIKDYVWRFWGNSATFFAKFLLNWGSYYISSNFFMKRSSSFIIQKCLVWRLSDFSRVTNLPGIPVPEPKSDLKIQKFISNDEEWGVKLHFWYKKIPPKNYVTFEDEMLSDG